MFCVELTTINSIKIINYSLLQAEIRQIFQVKSKMNKNDHHPYPIYIYIFMKIFDSNFKITIIRYLKKSERFLIH